MAIGSRKHRTPRVHGKKKAGGGDLHSEINVTPLVDVCLVLLIIFMVIMPMLQRGKEVPLPMTSHHDCQNPETDEEKKACQDKQQPIVAIDMDTRTGEMKYYVGQEPVKVGPENDPNRFNELRKQVEQEWDALKQKSDGESEGIGMVYLKAHSQIPYGKVRPVILALHDLGVPGIDLGTNEAKEK
jgi:biopolymer transport protein ExbD